MKILNLYAGIGGNRKLWDGDIEVTAVELNPQIAAIYQDFFPQDKVIVGDAHEYLLKHFEEFDFIWTSPPCPTHSRIRKVTSGVNGQNPPVFPDMKLYEEILLLQGYFKGKWVVENVMSWYDPLIKPYVYRKHYYWSNFVISGEKEAFRGHLIGIEEQQKLKGFDLSGYKLTDGLDKKKILRNCVEPQAGKNIFDMAFKEPQITLNNIQ
jgi:DNA (cytosine-5)-methyltransferase 1